jgi:hypothetical protein
VGVTEVSSRADDVLDFGEVDNLANDKVDHLAELSRETVGDISYTHVRATDSEDVADLHQVSLERASLSDVTGEETTLGKPNNVKLSFEELVAIKSFTGRVGLLLKVSEDRSLGSISNFNTEGISFSLLLNRFSEVDHARVGTSISETVEDGSRDRGSSGSNSGDTGSNEGFHFNYY